MNIYLDIDGVILANDKQKALFSDEFQVFNEEIRILKLNNKYNSWIQIDLSKNPNQLKHFLE